LYFSFLSAFDLKPPMPRSMSSARKESRTTGVQGMRSGLSHMMFATAMTSSAIASFFTASCSVHRLSSAAPSLKIHYFKGKMVSKDGRGWHEEEIESEICGGGGGGSVPDMQCLGKGMEGGITFETSKTGP
jgi:hypothetical protein